MAAAMTWFAPVKSLRAIEAVIEFSPPDLSEERNASVPSISVAPRLDAATEGMPMLICCWMETSGPTWNIAPPPVT